MQQKRQINEHSITVLWDNFNQSNRHGIAVLKGEDKEEEQEKNVKNNGQNFPKFDEYYKPTDPRKKLKELLSTRNTNTKAPQTAQNQS